MMREFFSKLFLSRDVAGELDAAPARLARVHPGILHLDGCTQDGRFHSEGDVWTHTKLVCAHLAESTRGDFLSCMAGLFHDIGKPGTKTEDEDGLIRFFGHADLGVEMLSGISQELGLAEGEMEALRFVVGEHMNAHNFPEMKPANRERLLRSPHREVLVALQDADALCSQCADGSHMPSNRLAFESALEELALADEVRARDEEFKRLITGKDLADLGVPKGPEIGRILGVLKQEFLSGVIKTREEAIAFARTLLPN